MNERIQELAELAWDETAVSRDFGHPTNFAERLADLIIRECLSCCEAVVADPVPEQVDTWLAGGVQCAKEIKYHFGME